MFLFNTVTTSVSFQNVLSHSENITSHAYLSTIVLYIFARLHQQHPCLPVYIDIQIFTCLFRHLPCLHVYIDILNVYLLSQTNSMFACLYRYIQRFTCLFRYFQCLHVYTDTSKGLPACPDTSHVCQFI